MLKLDTKQVFADALVELCRTKPLDKITVQNITDFCGAGRQTFYNHFKDKEDLIGYVFISDEKKCIAKLEKGDTVKEQLVLIFNTFMEKKQFYVSAYITHGQNSLGDVIFEHYVDYYTKKICEKTGEEVDEKLKSAVRFHCYGSIGYVRHWMKEGMKLSSEEMAEIIIDNIPERLKKYLD
ncbi:MAG: TetR/AcrR family transcriptional regulator C-terminal domain-containing protein [Oscillospiraceae bacterium]|nr:TetR/AcrR family transcriptional regulator C-terminal domain-containing protein [Oscillospiraceae bacterium]MBQ3561762.1 TetR/AcrR family transcriptional regulator C-terminal domain-containing protein [Oscillospiraceae bacterium]MBQ6699067.1 TetR/AcrR family transcriptional regulator C-terminal domain-containing protein [Oscillospiraceae bacterium]